jgi:hypothetical protein
LDYNFFALQIFVLGCVYPSPYTQRLVLEIKKRVRQKTKVFGPGGSHIFRALVQHQDYKLFLLCYLSCSQIWLDIPIVAKLQSLWCLCLCVCVCVSERERESI